MTIREEIEEWERNNLSPYASLSCESKGRDREEPECDIRPVYQRDRDRIIHCKSFRRLMHKTQVFYHPQGDHYRTRLTHTLEVSQNARTICKALMLNEELVEAIALGHDLGHTPFGHSGEAVLNSLCEGGFKHNVQSVRVVEKLEKDGRGLNLTWEVRDGILNHQTSTMPSTLEGKIVRYSDKIAYINHDIDDAIRAGLITEDDIPEETHRVLGTSLRKRLNTLIHDVIENSRGLNDIKMSEETENVMYNLRKFMFQRVYKHARTIEQEDKTKQVLRSLFDYYMNNTEMLPQLYLDNIDKGTPKDRSVCDYISGMTDQYAMNVFEEIFMPKSWSY
ncbi:MAG: deoxyguanosinetriphosphate triphosphohydrolase [Eubacterium sp.]|nr:deoxyguanosinetriphosphate triphosphohydrolase [Eubacterium sp.]